jgi:hypothetical protein
MATFSAAIATSADDARQAGTTMSLASTTLEFTAANHYGGVRFPNVTIPQGSTINTASLTFFLPQATHDDPDLTIWGDDTDNAAAFTTTASDISNRAATTATVQWVATSLGVGSKTTPDLATIIQELVDRPGYASGNALALILKANSTNPLRLRTFDQGSNFPQLDIDYTPPAAPAGAQSNLAHVRLSTKVGGLLTA